MKKEVILTLFVLIFIIGCQQNEFSYEEARLLKEQNKTICPEGLYEYGDDEGIICVECTSMEHCPGNNSFCGDEHKCYTAQTEEEMQKEEWVDDRDISVKGIGSCTEREECVDMLGVGAFCSKGLCFPPEEGYVEGQMECVCDDGTKVKAMFDCRNADCPGKPTEFIVKNGIVEKTTVEISFPLSKTEALLVGIKACGITEESEIPNNAYENLLSNCPSGWDLKDHSNRCNDKRAMICNNKGYVECSLGGEIGDPLCIGGIELVQKEFHEKFITANPVDLADMKKISKFRSCYGHDHSGYNIEGEFETERSMRHYLTAKSGVKKTNYYAPFNGTIIKEFVSPFAEGGDAAPEVWILGDHSGPWMFVHDHIILKEGLGILSRVESGQLIGTGSGGGEFTLNQDLSTETDEEVWLRGAPLDYMTDEVLKEYAQYGLTPENVVTTKEERDANPCRFPGPDFDDNWVYLS